MITLISYLSLLVAALIGTVIIYLALVKIKLI